MDIGFPPLGAEYCNQKFVESSRMITVILDVPRSLTTFLLLSHFQPLTGNGHAVNGEGKSCLRKVASGWDGQTLIITLIFFVATRRHGVMMAMMVGLREHTHSHVRTYTSEKSR